MKVCLALISLVLVVGQSHAKEDWRALIEAYDWAAHDTQITSDSEPAQNRAEKIDIRGLKRDTYAFLAYQMATIAVLYVMPESVSSWSEESKENYSLSQWEDNVRHPRWDEDDYFINYVLHPYWGATYYVRGRHRNLSRFQSFWYSVLLSTLYEYGAEAFFEQPSIQDLVVTPLGAVLIGDYFYSVNSELKSRHAAGEQLSRRERWVLVLTDPLDAINSKARQLFGKNAALQIRPFTSTGLDGFGVSPANNFPNFTTPRHTYGVEIKLMF
jgi:uncharacterized protein DUF3943